MWGNNGPEAVTQVLKDACGPDYVTPGHQCLGIHILHRQVFFPVTIDFWPIVFLPSMEGDILTVCWSTDGKIIIYNMLSFIFYLL